MSPTLSLSPTLAEVRAALRACPAVNGDFLPERSQSAVAIILAGNPKNLSMAFVRRSERPGDPWSGHIAFPGGRAQASDPSAQAVAERETEEETGLRLDDAERLAYLGSAPVNLRGRASGMVLHPFVFHLPGTPPPMRPSDEVAEGFWIPLADLFNPGFGAVHEVRYDGLLHRRPAIRWNGHTIWGLTWRTLETLAQRLDRTLAGHDPNLDDGYRPTERLNP